MIKKPRTVDHLARGSTKNAANCASLCKMQITRTSTCRTHIAGPKPWRFGSRTSEGRYRLEHQSVRVRLDSLARRTPPNSECVCGRDSSRPSVLPAFAGSACMGVLRRLLSLSRGGGQSTASPEIFRPRDAKHFASCVFERKKRVLA